MTLLNCSFIDSVKNWKNKGIFTFEYQKIKLIFRNCSFERNIEELYSIILFKTYNEITMENCSFVNNSASEIVYFTSSKYNQNSFPVSVLNCTFSKNNC